MNWDVKNHDVDDKRYNLISQRVIFCSQGKEKHLVRIDHDNK